MRITSGDPKARLSRMALHTITQRLAQSVQKFPDRVAFSSETTSITYTDLGRDTADMVDKILKGTPVSQIPVKFYLKAEDLKIFVNPAVTKALGITLPADVTSSKNYVEVTPVE